MQEQKNLRILVSLLAALGLLSIPAAARAGDKEAKPEHSAVKPVLKNKDRHEKFLEIAKKGNIDLLFLGDSITDAWGGEGHRGNAPGSKVFTKEFEPLKTANFGISGDRTQHVLWRLQNGELDGIKPKVVMLMIGTNNSNGNDNSAEEIADGITAIVKEVHKRSPETKVLVLGIFPRDEKPTARRDKLKKVNAIVAKLDDGGKTVKFLDIGAKFTMEDGAISRDIMPDYLHLSEKGYQIWADSVKGTIHEMLGK